MKEPARIRKLARDIAGRPVPWFVQWFDGTVGGDYGVGRPDFRMVDERCVFRALAEHRCFICGDRIVGRTVTFAIGPMCVVNRISAEPPSHWECAKYACTVCPWMLNPDRDRRENNMPAEKVTPTGMVERNPGVIVLWKTTHYKPVRVDRNTILCTFDQDPTHVEWWTRGRRATRDEAIESLDAGVPFLLAAARGQVGGPEADIADRLAIATRYLPEATVPA